MFGFEEVIFDEVSNSAPIYTIYFKISLLKYPSYSQKLPKNLGAFCEQF